MCSKAEYKAAWRWVRIEEKLDAMREAAWDVIYYDPYPEIEKYEAWQSEASKILSAENRWDMVDYAENALNARIKVEAWNSYIIPGENRRHKSYRAALIFRKNTETLAYWWRPGVYTYIGEMKDFAQMLRDNHLDDIPF